jgi:hypothetical protein
VCVPGSLNRAGAPVARGVRLRIATPRRETRGR